jgi:phosphonate transport system substrate-binding protein
VRRVAHPQLVTDQAAIELLAAPVFRAPRYGDRPVYYSDVIVHRESPFTAFAQLKGARWAYNETGSLSGYESIRYHLARLNQQRGYFGRALASGAHAQSLRWVIDGVVDCAAIDSTVLEQELINYPELAGKTRVVEVLGPWPMPPWVVSSTVPAEIRQWLRQALTTLHQSAAGSALVAATPVCRFAAVTEADYDPIRTMLQLAEQVTP